MDEVTETPRELLAAEPVESTQPEDHLEAGASADGASTEENAPEPDVAKQPALPTRMYFLRMPKPDISELEFRKEQAETELKAYKQACSKALAAAKLAHERKLQRREEHNQAFEQFNLSKQDRNTLRGRLRPVSDLNKQVREQRQDISNRKAQLPASTVAELDEKIAALEFKQAHEHLERREENNLISEIRKLKKSRPEVAKFELEYQAVESTRDEMATFKSTKADLEKQLDVVNEEFTLAKQQMDTKWQAYQEALEQHDAVSSEFTRLKEMQDAKFKECKELRDLMSSMQNSYYENRRFSQSVRTMLTKGQIDEAVQQCHEVTEAHISTLFSDADAYKDYVAGWELGRKYAVSQAAIDVATPPASKNKNGAASATKLANSDDILAGIMDEIEGRAPAKSAAEVAAQSVTLSEPQPSAAPQPAGKGRKTAKVTATTVATPAAQAFLDAHAAETQAAQQATAAAEPAPKPKKAEKPAAVSPPAASTLQPPESRAKNDSAGKPRAAPVVPDEEPFVPPAMYMSRQAPALTPEQQKQKIREEQKIKAAEAEERKRKQAERKAKKAEKAKEQAKRKEEAEQTRKAAEHNRIEREAAVQRALAQKKKEAQQRKAAAAAEKKSGKEVTAAKVGKPQAIMRSRHVSKSTSYFSSAKKFVTDYYIAVGAVSLTLIGAALVSFAPA